MNNLAIDPRTFLSMDDQEVWRRLKEILLKKSYQEGKFTLSSGQEADFYFNCKPTALDPIGATLLGLAFNRTMLKKFPQAVAIAGMTLGGDPLVTATSVMSFLSGGKPLSALILRKEAKGHGTGAQIEGGENVSEGSRVVVIDDVSTTAATLIKSVEIVRRGGYVVGGVVAVVDREEGASEALHQETGLELSSIFTRTQLLAQK
jgi:orotate phosphoribosyltransferase